MGAGKLDLEKIKKACEADAYKNGACKNCPFDGEGCENTLCLTLNDKYEQWVPELVAELEAERKKNETLQWALDRAMKKLKELGHTHWDVMFHAEAMRNGRGEGE
jgi:Holliday junction resolvasome RuvABC DNA-binding subunit